MTENEELEFDPDGPEGLARASFYSRLDDFKKNSTLENAALLQIELCYMKRTYDEAIGSEIDAVRKSFDDKIEIICKNYLKKKKSDETERKRIRKEVDTLLGVDECTRRKNAVQALIDKGDRADSAIHKVASKFNLSYSTIRNSYYSK
jgi:hypothetical protein